MKMYDCDVCMSAGSVNQWGYCEICGEDFEDPGSLVRWHGVSSEVSREMAEAGIATAKVSRADCRGAGRSLNHRPRIG